jgi:hypothetical protein
MYSPSFLCRIIIYSQNCLKTIPCMVFLVLKLTKIESERLFIPQGGRSRLPTFVKCRSAGFCPTSVVKKGPQVATLSRGRVFINISKIFTSQTMKLGHPNTNLYSHIQYTIFRTFYTYGGTCWRRTMYCT